MIEQLFGWLPAGIGAILEFLARSTGSAGIAIILLTILIRLALYPLTLKQTRSMLAMRELQPQLKEIQEKYKDNPQEYQKRTLQLYQEKGVNPFSGCLPLFIQLPFLWSLFAVLRDFDFESVVGSGQFLIWDMAAPDPWLILPILSGVTTYFMSAMTMVDQSQKTLNYIMPIFIAVISRGFASGLVLYWVVSNIFSIGQQYWLTKRGLSPVPKGGAKKK